MYICAWARSAEVISVSSGQGRCTAARFGKAISINVTSYDKLRAQANLSSERSSICRTNHSAHAPRKWNIRSSELVLAASDINKRKNQQLLLHSFSFLFGVAWEYYKGRIRSTRVLPTENRVLEFIDYDDDGSEPGCLTISLPYHAPLFNPWDLAGHCSGSNRPCIKAGKAQDSLKISRDHVGRILETNPAGLILHFVVRCVVEDACHDLNEWLAEGRGLSLSLFLGLFWGQSEVMSTHLSLRTFRFLLCILTLFLVSDGLFNDRG